MQPLNLEDLIPQPGKFTLNSTGEAYSFRMFSLEDEVWIAKNYPQDEFRRIFEMKDWEQISRIMFHQLDIESQMKFQKQEFKIVNEDTGEVSTHTLGGARLLLTCICGLKEQDVVIRAFALTRGLSQPVLDRLSAVENDESKKKVSPLTSQKSLTSSSQSTDGQLSTSSDEPQRRSAIG
jgi:succinate dehydrogenase flavin-adding protein (antitoxin of CptAB toxin-antitoxin module)